MNDMTRCLQGIRAAAIVVLSAQPWLAYADGRTDTIVLEGQTAPDGNGAFGRLEEVSLNAGGQVAFQSLDMTGTSGGANDDQGVFRGSGAEVTQIAREGQAAPDGNGAFGGFTGVGLNTGGQVAFGSFLMTGTSGGTGDNEGVFRGSGGNLTQIARKGQSAPDGNGAFGTSIRIALNAAGQVAFDSFFMTGTSGGFSDNEGVFRGSGGLATRIARKGQAAPDGNGAFGPFLGISINASGLVAFRSVGMTGTSGGFNDSEGVFRGSGGIVTQIARGGQAAPDGNGAFGRFFDVGLNTSGQVAFDSFDMTGTSDGTGDDEGVFRGGGGAVTQIAREGQAVPDGNGAFGGFGISGFNASGQVAFNSFSMTGTSGGTADDEGVFRGGGGFVTQIAREGQSAAGNGAFGSMFGRALNAGGQVAFESVALTGTSGGLSDDAGVFIGDGTEIVEVVRKGDLLDGSAAVNFSNIGINDFSQVAYRASRADGNSGIYVFTPDIRWRALFSSSWDSFTNWTLSIKPGAAHDVFIDPSSSLTITGPDTDVTVKSLEIGGGAGIATLALGFGTLTANEGTIVLPSGVLSGDGVLAGGVTNFGEVRADNVTIAGFLSNQALVTGTGRINAELTNDSAGEVRVGSGESLRLSAAAHTNAGRIEVDQGELEIDGTLFNQAGGRVLADDGVLRFNDGLVNFGQLNVTFGGATLFGNITIDVGGLVILSGNSNTTFFDTVFNGGKLRVSEGSVATFFGDVSGPGDYEGIGTKFYEAVFSPGASPGLVTDEGSAAFGAGATLALEIAGLAEGSEHDHYEVGGELAAGGTLQVSLLEGYAPEAGAAFDLLDWGTLTGEFDQVDLAGAVLREGLRWDMSRLYATGTLSVTAVPLPAGAWLLGSALTLLGWPRRRQARRRRNHD